MRFKNTLLFGLTTLMSGFIPLVKHKQENITYVIYSDSIAEANIIKEELITFFKDCCYSSLFADIDNKLNKNIDKFIYNCNYSKQSVVIDEGNKIKMMGYLYKTSPSSINFKYYFSSSICSIPDATSINVATSTESDQI